MKKIKYLIIILITFFSVNLTCNATTQTYVRTTDNLMLPDDVKFDSSNINYEEIYNRFHYCGEAELRLSVLQAGASSPLYAARDNARPIC